MPIPRSILNDNPTTKHWSRMPGKFVNPLTGKEIKGIQWEGNVQQWYDTLGSIIQQSCEEIKLPNLSIWVCPELFTLCRMITGFQLADRTFTNGVFATYPVQSVLTNWTPSIFIVDSNVTTHVIIHILDFGTVMQYPVF